MPLTTEQKEILASFQSDYTRTIEEQFAQILTERSDVRLFFINENRCFTDGKNITIDPAERELFTDKMALERTEKYMNLNNEVSSDPWLALKLQTRASNIHESLHILYSNFPFGFLNDKRASSEIRILVLSHLSNIIEDAFIEAAGCSLYDNLEQHLLWNRIALFYSKAEIPDTLEMKFEEAGIKIDAKAIHNSFKPDNDIPKIDDDAIKFAKLMAFLNFMTFLLLYPFFEAGSPPGPLLEYVDKSKSLFFEASKCGNAVKREEYVKNIFDIIEPLIPESTNINLPSSIMYLMEDLKSNYSNNSTFCSNTSIGKEVVITRRLFTDENDNPVLPESLRNRLKGDIENFLLEKGNTYILQGNKQVSYFYDFSNFDCSNLHRNIKLEVIKPKINRNFKRAYQNIISKYRLAINSYSSQISQFLKLDVEEKESKNTFGNGISSKYLGDTKKRFWYRKIINQGIPDIGFLFLIDGSASMEGERIGGIISAMVIIHEILQNNNILHSIVEHRAIYDEPKLIHNIIVDFHYKNDEKYNILSLDAKEGTREGFSLYWAEKHIKNNCSSEYKVIIMVSDGAPAHTCDDSLDYTPPVSIKDTAEAAKKIIKRGTSIIALALDSSDDDTCYRQLKMIYPHVVSCVDINKFTGQLLHIISGLFQRGIG